MLRPVLGPCEQAKNEPALAKNEPALCLQGAHREVGVGGDEA